MSNEDELRRVLYTINHASEAQRQTTLDMPSVQTAVRQSEPVACLRSPHTCRASAGKGTRSAGSLSASGSCNPEPGTGDRQSGEDTHRLPGAHEFCGGHAKTAEDRRTCGACQGAPV